MLKLISNLLFRNNTINDTDLRILADTEFRKDADFAYYWMKQNRKITELKEMK